MLRSQVNQIRHILFNSDRGFAKAAKTSKVSKTIKQNKNSNKIHDKLSEKPKQSLVEQLYAQSNTPYATQIIPSKNSFQTINKVSKKPNNEPPKPSLDPSQEIIETLNSLRSNVPSKIEPSTNSTQIPSITINKPRFSLTPEQKAEKRRRYEESRRSLNEGLEAITRATEFDDPASLKRMYHQMLVESEKRREEIINSIQSNKVTIDPTLQVDEDGKVYNPLNKPGVPEAFRLRLSPHLMGLSPLTKKKLEAAGKTIENIPIPEQVLETIQNENSKLAPYTTLNMTIHDYNTLLKMAQSKPTNYERFVKLFKNASEKYEKAVYTYVAARINDSVSLAALFASTEPSLQQHRKLAEEFVSAAKTRFITLSLKDVNKLSKDKRNEVVRQLSDLIGDDNISSKFETSSQSNSQHLLQYAKPKPVEPELDPSYNPITNSKEVKFPTKFFLLGCTFILISFAMTTIWDYYMEMTYGITPPSAFNK